MVEPTGIEPVTCCLQSTRSRFQRCKWVSYRGFLVTGLGAKIAPDARGFRRLSWFRALPATSARTVTAQSPLSDTRFAAEADTGVPPTTLGLPVSERLTFLSRCVTGLRRPQRRAARDGARGSLVDLEPKLLEPGHACQRGGPGRRVGSMAGRWSLRVPVLDGTLAGRVRPAAAGAACTPANWRGGCEI